MIDLEIHTSKIIDDIKRIIENARQRAAVYLNAETTLLYWQIGRYLNNEIINANKVQYGAKILATVSQQLALQYGKGFTYSSVTRMCKVAKIYDEENIATVSQQLNWSHLIELSSIGNQVKRDFYAQLCIYEKWGVRELRAKCDAMLFERTAIAAKPEATIKEALQFLKQDNILKPDLVFKNSYVLNFLNLPADYSENDLEQALISNLQQFILELGNGFAFIERQKRITVDAVDYHLDLLFYHRKLKRLVAIDLKLGKFKPKYKSQMELYLRWLQRYEMQNGEDTPIGLLLCSEGNTEHIELLMLDEKEIKVAQYLTELPSKEWFADKLHRAMVIAQQNLSDKKNRSIDEE